ncbi:tetratricopeptide repeat protein [Delftia sp. PS-11]|uniref:tetratricopeptide repeat protein n=1 Tax=Delftia sp. PS-11 TaxID=2767222 RepID=UPI0024545E3F|nr:tetratricopeptide repeat protein [Delftia sp. PS-11]KAJ8746668.1 tetratricopeptide repeat protein [Delftia sp. PS-11]
MVHPLRLQGIAVAAALALGSAASWALPGKNAAAIEAQAAEPAAAAADAEEERAALNAELFYEILVGEIAASEGALTDAQAMMMEAARTSGNEQLYRRGTELALQSRSGERALANARAWLQAFPESRDANRYALQILVALNRIADSASHLQREIALTPAPSKPATYLAITQLYNNARDKALAADVVEQAMADETSDPVSGPLAWATIGHMRLGAGQKAAAMQAVHKAQALTPDTGAIALLSMELLEAGVADAEPIVQRYIAKNPSPQLRMAYARVLLGQQRQAEARQQLEAIAADSPDYPEAWATLAGLQLQAGEIEKAQASAEQLGRLVPQIPAGVARSAAQSQYYLLLAQVAEKQGRYAEADALLRRIDDAPNLLSVQARRASLLARQGKLKEARALIEAVPASGPSQQRLKRLAEVQLLRDAGQHAQAYALQSQLQKQDPDDAELAYDTALLAERTGNFDDMEKLLRGIIARKPDFQHAYNALGYSFAERGIHLQEAEQLVRKALDMSPGDPFITDSLAWVKFRQGNVQQALQLLEEAYAARPDVEIAAHLGEVLWASGQQERAREIWRQGMASNPDNSTLRETLQRLGVSL